MIAGIANPGRRARRLVRLVIASGAATAVDVATLLVLVSAAGLAAGPASVVGCLAGGAVNFAINRAWVFRRRREAWLTQALRYGVVVVGGGAVVSGLAVAAAVAAGAPVLIAKAAAVVIALVAWTYPMSARVVFAAPASGEAAARAAVARGEAADPQSVLVLR